LLGTEARFGTSSEKETNDLMYGNTAKSIGAKSRLYGGFFRHSNPSKSNSISAVWEVCARALSL
jgi:hypothetical protein